nr:hypothetical protein CFP56_55410 [Quercus suber]
MYDASNALFHIRLDLTSLRLTLYEKALHDPVMPYILSFLCPLACRTINCCYHEFVKRYECDQPHQPKYPGFYLESHNETYLSLYIQICLLLRNHDKLNTIPTGQYHSQDSQKNMPQPFI